MSPLNRGPTLSPRIPPVGMRPMPPPRFGGRLPHSGMPLRLPPHPMNPMFAPMRQLVPLPGPGRPIPLFGPRVRGMAPMMMGPRGMGPRGPPMRLTPRGMLPPQRLPHMRSHVPLSGGSTKIKGINNSKKVSKLEELELKKPWMTDEIRSEIQKKNKLYAKAKKNKDAKEWEEFKDLRNKVTRMIRDAKTEYLAQNPEQIWLYLNDDQSPYDTREENSPSSEEEHEHYCEVCDREFPSEHCLTKHIAEHRVCEIDGCVFAAHPKLVEKHISMQHSTGLYHRMKNLSTPEDIAKWIMERKTKYPTKANIIHLKAEASEKQQRYEVIKEKKTVNKGKLTKPELKKMLKRRTRRRQVTLPVNTKTPETQLYKGLEPFMGTLVLRELMSDTESLIEDSDNEADSISTTYTPEAHAVGSATGCDENDTFALSLVADYGTDSEKENGPEEISFKKIKGEVHDVESVAAIPNPDVCKNNNKFSSRNNDGRNKLELFEKTMQHANKSKHEQGNQRFPITSKEHRNVRRTVRETNQTRLLNKLLSRSIQHERNLICQCLKYIVDNNYFE